MTLEKKFNLLAIWLVLLSLVYLMGFTYTLDCASPVGTDAPSTIDDKIRETRYGFQERLNVDHYFPMTGTEMSDADTGYHRDIHFYSTTGTDPVLDFTTVGGIDELRYTDSAGTSKTLTSNGTLNIVSSDLLGTLANNTYFTAVDSAGTGTVNLIKANASNVAVIPDGSETATSAAPTADADIANKAYVDAQINATVGSGTMSPLAYAGEESVTFPNGVIWKQGNVAWQVSATITVTFAEAFPTAATRAFVTVMYSSASTTTEVVVSALSTTTLTLKTPGATATSINWCVIGY